ncbi:hypothetical protein CEXT_264891 [Caerostris extrusa]|uniref:Uncharacterized protein n=1 Tax=Caerostris extrusa TaxID=172846 RepID=A0AAV4WWB5_CAEEX|nr:hypothetical protein CEXT_264891 [Caerostris extrusa]
MVCAFDSPPDPLRFTIPSLSPLAQGVLNLQTDLFLNGNAQLHSLCPSTLTWKRDKMKNDTPNRTSSGEIEKKDSFFLLRKNEESFHQGTEKEHPNEIVAQSSPYGRTDPSWWGTPRHTAKGKDKKKERKAEDDAGTFRRGSLAVNSKRQGNLPEIRSTDGFIPKIFVASSSDVCLNPVVERKEREETISLIFAIRLNRIA